MTLPTGKVQQTSKYRPFLGWHVLGLFYLAYSRPRYTQFHCPPFQLPVVNHGPEADDPPSDVSSEGQ